MKPSQTTTLNSSEAVTLLHSSVWQDIREAGPYGSLLKMPSVVRGYVKGGTEATIFSTFLRGQVFVAQVLAVTVFAKRKTALLLVA